MLIAVSRTAILCSGLGLALYALISHAAQYAVFVPVAALIGALFFILLMFSDIRYALLNGLIPAKSNSIRKDKRPGALLELHCVRYCMRMCCSRTDGDDLAGND
jgi:hypothetical protein